VLFERLKIETEDPYEYELIVLKNN